MKVLSKLFLSMVLLGSIACSILDGDDSIDQSKIDYLFGVEESGRIKRQVNYSDSEDETVNSDVIFDYNNGVLKRKTYNDFLNGSYYVLKQEDFSYEEGNLIKMTQYFRNTPNGPIEVSKNYLYSYPEENKKVEVIYYSDGELKDSVVYTYSRGLLTEERHFNHLGEWGTKFEYNTIGKLYKYSDLAETYVEINYFDEQGVLKSSALLDDDGETVLQLISYEREVKRDRLVIRKYIKDMRVNTVGPFLTSHRVYENGKLVEEVKYHPTMGGEWYCCRYEYYNM